MATPKPQFVEASEVPTIVLLRVCGFENGGTWTLLFSLHFANNNPMMEPFLHEIAYFAAQRCHGEKIHFLSTTRGLNVVQMNNDPA